MNKWGKALIGAGILLFVCLVVWVVSTTPEPPPEEPLVDPSRKMTYDGNTLSGEQNGKKLWDLTAEHMEVDMNTNDTELENLVGHFYQEDGTSVELRAERGVYQKKKNEIHTEGSVVVTTTDGAKLTSDRLDWAEKEGMLTAEGKAKIEKDDLLAEGDRIESKDGFTHFWIRGNAHIVKGVKKE